MSDPDLIEDIFAFLSCTQNGTKQKRGSEVCGQCGQTLECDPNSGEYKCPECDD